MIAFELVWLTTSWLKFKSLSFYSKDVTLEGPISPLFYLSNCSLELLALYVLVIYFLKSVCLLVNYLWLSSYLDLISFVLLNISLSTSYKKLELVSVGRYSEVLPVN